MNHRQLLGFPPLGRLLWMQVVVAGVLVVSGGQAARARTQALEVINVTADPVAPLPVDPVDSTKLRPGTGLCASYRTTTAPQDFFPSRAMGYPASVTNGTEPFAESINRFLDGQLGTPANSGVISYQTLQTPFDLAAFAPLGLNTDGDFIATPACAPSRAGCAFPGSGANDKALPPFASRFRGFLRVPNELAGQAIHFGFTANSAVAMRVWPKLPTTDGKAVPYELISRAFTIGQADFRVTNAIRFSKPGLYAVEILHASANDAARLELAMTILNFDDIDERSGVTAVPLGRSGFQLTTPEQFFQRVDGALPFPGKSDQCQQCPRVFANAPSQPPAPHNGCPAGLFCNEAAVCSPSVSDSFCGESGRPCSAVTPYCAPAPGSPRMDYICVACRPSRQTCQSNQCIACVAGTPGCESPECVGAACPPDPTVMGCSVSARRGSGASAPWVPYVNGAVLLSALALLGARRLRAWQAARPPKAA